MRPGLPGALFFQQCLKLGNGLQVLGPAGRTFDVDQVRQVETAARRAEDRDLDGVLSQLVVGPTAGDLPDPSR